MANKINYVCLAGVPRAMANQANVFMHDLCDPYRHRGEVSTSFDDDKGTQSWSGYHRGELPAELRWLAVPGVTWESEEVWE